MESIRKKAGYLEGLLSAIKPDENDPNGQLLSGIVSLLSELADRAEATDDMIGELNDYVESIDDDLSELEGMHDDEDMDFADGDFDEDFEGEEPLRLIKSDKADAPQKVFMPGCCPRCGATFLIDGAPGERKFVCPSCKKKVRPERLTEKNTPVAEPVEE